MKHKTSELVSPELDAAVVKALGRILPDYYGPGGPSLELRINDDTVPYFYIPTDYDVSSGTVFIPSANWQHGGPIIEREQIGLLPSGGHRGDQCQAFVYSPSQHDLTLADAMQFRQHGPTPLIAAMRAYVASKLGEEVELP